GEERRRLEAGPVTNASTRGLSIRRSDRQGLVPTPSGAGILLEPTLPADSRPAVPGSAWPACVGPPAASPSLWELPTSRSRSSGDASRRLPQLRPAIRR